ncbi:hypothetical protein D3C72_1314280 [compost metagenome]
MPFGQPQRDLGEAAFGQRQVAGLHAVEDAAHDGLALVGRRHVTAQAGLGQRLLVQPHAVGALGGHQRHLARALRGQVLRGLARHVQQLDLRKALLQVGVPRMRGVAGDGHGAAAQRGQSAQRLQHRFERLVRALRVGGQRAGAVGHRHLRQPVFGKGLVAHRLATRTHLLRAGLHEEPDEVGARRGAHAPEDADDLCGCDHVFSLLPSIRWPACR